MTFKLELWYSLHPKTFLIKNRNIMKKLKINIISDLHEKLLPKITTSSCIERNRIQKNGIIQKQNITNLESYWNGNWKRDSIKFISNMLSTECTGQFIDQMRTILKNTFYYFLIIAQYQIGNYYQTLSLTEWINIKV